MKLLAIASSGGHWKEIIRITKALQNDFELCYVCTRIDMASLVEGVSFYTITDFSRSNCLMIIIVFFQAIRIIIKEKPVAVITTGAAPGLIMVFVGWLFGKKTIWIDSLANVKRLSLSGRIASLFVSRIYTQWKELQKGRKIVFAGNVLE